MRSEAFETLTSASSAKVKPVSQRLISFACAHCRFGWLAARQVFTLAHKADVNCMRVRGAGSTPLQTMSMVACSPFHFISLLGSPPPALQTSRHSF